jgi:hypothetical protein
MLDIMREDPAEFIQLLQQARLNDDIEVTHYASTAMMEFKGSSKSTFKGRKGATAHPRTKSA